MLMMGFDTLLLWISELISKHLYEGIFLAALIETAIPPVPTLLVFPTAGFLASQHGLSLINVMPLIFLGAAGSTVGTTGIYVIALKLGRAVLLRYLRFFKISDKKLGQVETWFEKYGDKAVFLGRMIPVMREMISVPAGLLKMRIIKFLAYTFMGSCVWAAGTILAGYYFGQGIGLGII
jgi:membrane protein DedA with SNARE-associated domain